MRRLNTENMRFLTSLRLIHTSTGLSVNPKSTKSKSHSSHQWLERQMKDPYVEKAKQENYRCRSAFKLLEINDRFKIFSPGQVVVDCGAAPGSWSQVAARLTNSNESAYNRPRGRVVAIDRLPIHPIAGVEILGNLDFTTEKARARLNELLEGFSVDIVMSDMAPNATGVRELDHDKIIELVYFAMKFALLISKTDGTFLAKVWDGGRSKKLEEDIGKFYKSVKIVRPEATRDESTEKFILARGFKGLKQKTASS